ncbi:hypothetical protein ACH9EU_15265 [Kocuria sp. M1R5S2]|uniref:hypothetical protein n=1 Tax=Kocuria rhizosphaerae TaxID=3376285 RepID=UPI0037926A0C
MAEHLACRPVVRRVKRLQPLAHLPSAKYADNAAWISCTAIAFNLARGHRGGRA